MLEKEILLKKVIGKKGQKDLNAKLRFFFHFFKLFKRAQKTFKN